MPQKVTFAVDQLEAKFNIIRNHACSRCLWTNKTELDSTERSSRQTRKTTKATKSTNNCLCWSSRAATLMHQTKRSSKLPEQEAGNNPVSSEAVNLPDDNKSQQASCGQTELDSVH